MSTVTKVFITGATGYIGGAVLTLLLDYQNLDITALVRSPDKAKLLEAIGIRVVVGSNADHTLLSAEASLADVTFACADADDMDAAKAILRGIKTRFKRSSQQATLIHTSGTGVLSTESHGMFATDTVYSDMNIPLLETLAPSQPHREVDLALVKADQQGYVRTYIVLPSTIYGRATGLLVDQKIANPMSQQIPNMVRTSFDRGQAGVIGQGKNLWPNVEIHEVASLFLAIFQLTLSLGHATPKEFQHGRYGFYCGENGEHSMMDMATAMAGYMYDIGVGTTKPTTFTPEEMARYFPGPTSLSTNSRCRSDRGKAIGWAPVKTTQDMLRSIKQEVLALQA